MISHEQQLDIISQAWGNQDGYVFFPTIAGDADDKDARVASYDEGPAFHWPHERDEILEHMREHADDDLYWCPNIFEAKRRQIDQAMDEHALWADLDEVDPRDIDDGIKPTVAWETSPGRYQALWLFMRGTDVLGASWAGGENQRLTYHLQADRSGWDSTQLLRIPGWPNHKPEHRRKGKAPQGKLLWHDRSRRYLPDHFEDLPEIDAGAGAVKDVLEGEIERVDRHEVWGKIRLKVSKAVREFVGARETSGDRSEVLWQIERELADAGLTVVEIVAIVRGTVWNKYLGRADELKRLTVEASRAVEAVPEDVQETLEASLEAKGRLRDLDEQLEGLSPPEWLVEHVWTLGGCGFIAGEPKSFKSWISLDLAYSLATGSPFLGEFKVLRPGPVALLLEEDGLRRVKARRDKIWPGKQTDRMKVQDDGTVVWEPSTTLPKAKVSAMVKQGFVASDPGWLAWLDDELTQGYGKERDPYVAIILDPFLMMLGDVDENKAGALNTQIFKPLKDLADKHQVAIIVVHHLRKNGNAGSGAKLRGGQMMLGSQAFHGWTDDALYVTHQRGDLLVEAESKDGSGGTFRITGLRTKGWTPGVADLHLESEDDAPPDQPAGSEVRQARRRTQQTAAGTKAAGTKVEIALRELGKGPHTTRMVADQAGLTTDAARRQLNRAPNAIPQGAGLWDLRS